MKTTTTILLAAAALSGLALILWNRMVKKETLKQIAGELLDSSKHRTPVFSGIKKLVQENM